MAHSKSEIKKAKNLLNKYAPKGEELAYINSKEAKLLKRMGGAGKDINGTGIKSYIEYGSDDPDTMAGATGSSSGGGGGNNSGGDNPYEGIASRPAPQKSMLSRAVTAVGNYIKGGGLIGMGLTAIGKYNEKNNPRSKTNDPKGLYAEGLTTGKRNFVDSTGGSSSNNILPAQNVGGRIVKLSPTSAEISQSKATDVTYDSRKTKARGRSMTIRTNSRGVGNNMASVLGKKSLLGAA